MNITFTPQIRNNNVNFRSRYTAAEICADLCKGACCNHGTPMSATLKKIADKFNATYYQLPDDLKSSALIKAPILNWVIDSSDIEANRVNNLANVYIDAISRENNPQKIEALKEALELLNQKLESMLGENEAFLSITNPVLAQNPKAAIFSKTENPCAFKDHGKTNKCTIYSGVPTEGGKVVKRPQPCHVVGSEELPCPWLNPEKLDDVVAKTRASLARMGYKNIPDNVINNYVKEQYNLNETWLEKIYKPFLRGENR